METALQDQLVAVGRIALAALLGFLIGWERESHGSPAGDRTHALVALGAASFTVLGNLLSSTDTSRIIQGIVAGIGFLGGGMIMREGMTVRGLTTAAGIWAVAALGVVVGRGEYLLGVALMALILLILVWERLPLVSRIGVHKRESQGTREDT